LSKVPLDLQWGDVLAVGPFRAPLFFGSGFCDVLTTAPEANGPRIGPPPPEKGGPPRRERPHVESPLDLPLARPP